MGAASRVEWSEVENGKGVTPSTEQESDSIKERVIVKEIAIGH